MATTSQPRSLLSTARLNRARSRTRPSICSLVRIAQTCFGRSGGFAPVSLPLFQGTRLGDIEAAITSSCISILLGDKHREEWASGQDIGIRSPFGGKADSVPASLHRRE